jgi:hypothetical protein
MRVAREGKLRPLAADDFDRTITVPEPAASGACAGLVIAALRALVRRAASG